MRSAVLSLSVMIIYAGINGVYAQTIPEAPGPTDHAFDITQLESYKLFPNNTILMLELEPGEPAITVEFGQAYDEIRLLLAGLQNHTSEERAEFLENLDIRSFSKMYNNTLSLEVDPSQQDRLDDIRQQLHIMYPGINIEVDTIVVIPATSQTMTNTAIPILIAQIIPIGYLAVSLIMITTQTVDS